MAPSNSTRGARSVVVNGALCKGCGSCSTACPANAAQVRHFKAEQIFAELTALWMPCSRWLREF
jgi:heterodisulfide reductase subunit A-like polyferredoxin